MLRGALRHPPPPPPPPHAPPHPPTPPPAAPAPPNPPRSRDVKSPSLHVAGGPATTCYGGLCGAPTTPRRRSASRTPTAGQSESDLGSSRPPPQCFAPRCG